MQQAPEAPVHRLDALLPPDMARHAEDVGARKATLDSTALLTLAGLAGAFIALGGVFSTVALAGTAGVAWGPARVLAGVTFSLGLVLVVVGGAELFTGNTLIVMAWAARRITGRALLRNWAAVYAGNALGAVLIAALVALGGTHRLGGGAVGTTAFAIATAKLGLGLTQAVILGVLGNVLVCLAVWLSYSARTTTDRLLCVVLPVAAFVAAGFEHSVANMYLIPVAWFVAAVDPAFVQAQGLGSQADVITWGAIVLRNLLPVTLGNIIGGAGLVGGVYWFVYLRKRAGAAQPPR